MATQPSATDTAGSLPVEISPDCCALCGSTACVRLFEKDHAEFFTCTKCTFRFAITARNANLENTIDEFETSYLQYFKEAPRDKINFDNLVSWMSKFCSISAGPLLDVGCGSGKFVRYLRESSIPAYGTEPSEALYRHFLSKEECFFHGTIASLPAHAPKKYSVITAFDVIEHVNEPLKTVSLMASLVEPGGWIFVSTPDVGSLHARIMGKRWHYYHRYHLSYWSRKTLEQAAARFSLTSHYYGQRSRYQTLGYVMSYFWEHILERKAPPIFSKAEGMYFPVNLFDVMYLAFQKRV